MRIEPASSLPPDRLADVFTRVYEGYLVPVSMDEAGFRAMVETYDLDLDASRLAVEDDGPVALANLAVRDHRGWIAGMGVAAPARRRGLGEAVMRAVLDEARDRGLREVWLEVIEGNDAAIALYEKLGFERVRDLELWTLEPSDKLSLGREAPFDEALARVRELRDRPAPWQCAEETLAKAGDARGFVGERSAALFRPRPGGVAVFQVAGDAREAFEALRAGGTVAAFNVPAGPATDALSGLGARLDLRQHEMVLVL